MPLVNRQLRQHRLHKGILVRASQFMLVEAAIGANPVAKRNVDVEMLDQRGVGELAVRPMMEEHELGGKLLSAVSRSFYLTLKALPREVREPLSLAYLLARAADTMADTPNMPDKVREDSLQAFDAILQSPARDTAAEAKLHELLLADFVSLQTDESEAALLRRLPEALNAYRSAPERHQLAMRQVLKPIVRGQLLDITRFPMDGQFRTLANAAELDEYTWLVAGCVGKFWTKLCASELPAAFESGVSAQQMTEWGIRYGKGLQLVNILRDVGKDAAMGRCYLPMDEIIAHGINPDDVLSDISMLRPVTDKWVEICRGHLKAGIDYLGALKEKKLRYATALPLLLGVRTLALVEKAEPGQWKSGVKVPRSEVAKWMIEAGLASMRRDGLRRLIEKAMGA